MINKYEEFNGLTSFYILFLEIPKLAQKVNFHTAYISFLLTLFCFISRHFYYPTFNHFSIKNSYNSK